MIDYPEEDWLMLSGIQHFSFCRRQWALIHLEGQWADNLRTVDGGIFHQNAHNEEFVERRGDTLIVRGLRIFSRTLGVSGACDVVEFHLNPQGVSLGGQEGLWLPFPVEYKRGEPKENNADALQLCAQAMCLEEMLSCEIPSGSLFYGEPRRRYPVVFISELREQVRSCFAEMHELSQRGHTPKCRPTKSCNACSLKSICLPRLNRTMPVAEYLKIHEGEME